MKVTYLGQNDYKVEFSLQTRYHHINLETLRIIYDNHGTLVSYFRAYYNL